MYHSRDTVFWQIRPIQNYCHTRKEQLLRNKLRSTLECIFHVECVPVSRNRHLKDALTQIKYPAIV